MTIYLVISLPKIPYIHRVYIWSWPTLRFCQDAILHCSSHLLTSQANHRSPGNADVPSWISQRQDKNTTSCQDNCTREQGRRAWAREKKEREAFFTLKINQGCARTVWRYGPSKYGLTVYAVNDSVRSLFRNSGNVLTVHDGTVQTSQKGQEVAFWPQMAILALSPHF